MTEWNFDMTSAPRGETVVVEQWRKTSDGVKLAKVETFAPDWIWAATAGGEVVKSHFVPPTKHHPEGRWMNLHSESEPIAWLPFVKPSHPSLLTANPARAQ